jgi:ribosomal-protein-alanine N-acetyltransferase
LQFSFSPITEADIRAIASWRYDAPYDVYNWSAQDDPSEMLDRRSPYYAVRDEQGELIGFFAYGSSAEVWDQDEPHLYSDNDTITIGLGMRPDLTSRGLGLAFVQAGLDFAREHFHPVSFRLYVMTFNERAIRVYERAGFARVGIYIQQNPGSRREFLEMRCQA